MTEDLKQHDADFIDEPESSAAASALGREVRFGLSLLGLLLAMLAAAVYVKLGTPGLPWGKSEVAAADSPEDAALAPAEDTAHAEAAQPQAPVPAQEDTSSAKPLWNNDRYTRQHEAVPPADAPLPVGNVEPAMAEAPAEMAPSNPFAVVDQAQPGAIDQVSAEGDAIPEREAIPEGPTSEAPAFAAPAMMVAGAERAASNNDEPPAEMQPEADLAADAPADGAPLVAAEENELRGAASCAPRMIQPAAGQQPTLAEPRNAPYGRTDRFANAPRNNMRDGSFEEGPRAAPSAEHTPLHAVPNQQWNTPGAAPAADPYATPLEHDLQNARTPAYQPHHASPPPATNDLDAPAAEFAPPQDDISRHQHHPAHIPTPDGTYAVEPNDSFWTISQKVYGTGGYFKAVQRHNRKPGANADGLEIGERILVPPVEELEQRYPQLCPKRRGAPQPGARSLPTSSQGYGGRVYVVQDGDTLFDIARYELGKASRWAEIYNMNRDQLGSDYNYVAPGTKLMLPDEAMSQPDNVTSRPGSQFPR
jgi:nucleoid-associated protein YgaU